MDAKNIQQIIKAVPKSRNLMEAKDEYEFLTNHSDYAFFWEMVSWKLNAMRDFFLTDAIGANAKETAEQIAEALKYIDMLVDDKYQYVNKDFISGKKLPEHIQKNQFNDSLDSFVRILKKHSRSWWD